ncbi:MAG: zinc-binding alcohol dehydrogenase family protein, partial [Pseudomonadota bacterium]|nr:zinc-binding alcohol dehydrogenase family protein [Pseudomonadota bacterium]
VDERIASLAPKSLSDAQAAALPLTAITAWELLFDRLELGMRDTQGKTLLVVGAAGGVGSILIQLAKQLTDITVIGTASRPESQAWVTSLGADAVIDHRQPLDEALKAAGYEQVDMVISLNQTDHHFEAIINALKPQGKLALIDDPELIDVRKLKLKSLSLHWELMFTRPLFTTEDIAKQHDLLSEVAAMVDSGRLTTTLGEVLGPINADNLTRAHALIESNRTVGKLVLEGF